jgi:flagellar biosynthesis protein FlhF
MNLKTYRARSMAAALAEVKKDLGSAAVILRTRSYRVGGVMGVGGHEEYEITAADGPIDGVATSGPMLGTRGSRSLSAAAVGSEAMSEMGVPSLSLAASTRDIMLEDGSFQPATFGAIGGTPVASRASQVQPASGQTHQQARQSTLVATAVATPAQSVAIHAGQVHAAHAVAQSISMPVSAMPAHAQPTSQPTAPSLSQSVPQHVSQPVSQQVELKPSAQPALSGKQQLTTAVDFAPTDGAAQKALQAELSSIRRLMGTLLAETRRGGSNAGPMAALSGLSPSTSPSAVSGASDALTDIFMTLHDACVRPDLIDRIVGGVRDELTPDELQQPQIVRLSTLRQLAAMLRVRTTVAITPSQTPRTIALIGTTGVGKTTTIAKLAAMFKIKHGLRVGLITIDTYRIAAVEQLRTYANIIGLPLEVCLTPSDVEQACARLSTSCDLILLDTAGRSQHDNRRLDELSAFVQAARPHEVHLVLSIASSDTVIASAARRFSHLRPDAVILTKLDEAVAHGSVLNAAVSVGLPVSFVTMGQEVPDHLDIADAHRLARLILESSSQDSDARARSGEAACPS